MSEIKPVYQVQQLGEWIEVDKSIFDELYIQNKFSHRILYPAAAYEALQKENKSLNIKVQSLNFDNAGLSNIVMDWQRLYENSKAENAAQAKRIAELEEKLKYRTNTAC